LTTFFIPLALIGLAVAVMLPYQPPHYVNRDGGIFLYIGRELTLGKRLYVDVWDHKGPLLFYINALGYWLGKRTGVWLLECVFLSISTMAAYTVLKKSLNPWFALIGTVSWLYSFFCIIAGGNYTEEYSLLMSFLSILCFHQYLRNEKGRYLFGVGIAIGLNILLRPNNIGVQLVISTILVISDLIHLKFARGLKDIFLISMGTCTVLIPTFLFFFWLGNFNEFIYATFLFNFIYANVSNQFNLSALLLFVITLGWPCWFAILGWFLVIRDTITKTSPFPLEISLFLILGFPIEIILDTLSGRPYVHYVLMLLPYIGFLSAYFLFKLFPFFRRQNQAFKLGISILLIFVLFFSFWSANGFLKRIDETSPQINEYSEIITFIKTKTTPSDYILVWGQELSLNLLSEREAPTLYGHQTFFLIPGMVTPLVEQRFLSDLQTKHPALIIITDALPFLDNNPETFEEQLKAVTPGAVNVFRSFSEYVHQNYHPVKTIQNFKIFSLNK
jgi:hypothetical protein